MTERERDADRDAGIWRDRTRYGMTTIKLARKYNLSQQRISQILAAMRAEIPVDVREQAVVETAHLYRELLEEAVRLADMPLPPVTAGKDGDPVYDPTTQEVVRDVSGRLRALETAARMGEHYRKLMGLDAAVKVEQVITDQSAADKAAAEAEKRLEALELDEEGTES